MLAFVHIHKTGGSTINWILRSFFGPSYCEIEPIDFDPSHRRPWQMPISIVDLQWVNKIYPNLKSIGGHCVQPHTDIDKTFTNLKYFTIIRNPLSARASMYAHGVYAFGENNCKFDKWLQQDQSQNRPTKMIAGSANADEAIRLIKAKNIFVGLTERFDESMLLIKKFVANRLNIFYRRMNVTTNKSIAQKLLASIGTRKMLIKDNQEDIKLYEFVQHELYPDYQRKY